VTGCEGALAGFMEEDRDIAAPILSKINSRNDSGIFAGGLAMPYDHSKRRPSICTIGTDH